jgi:hypothetical protein
MNIKRRTLGEFFKQFDKRKMIDNKRSSGRPRKMTKAAGRLIRRISVASPMTSATEIAKKLETRELANVSPDTVRRRLHGFGLFGRHAVKKPLISLKNRKARLAFAREHIGWTMEQWKRVLWSDESKFQMFCSDGLKYV